MSDECDVPCCKNNYKSLTKSDSYIQFLKFTKDSFIESQTNMNIVYWHLSKSGVLHISMLNLEKDISLSVDLQNLCIMVRIFQKYPKSNKNPTTISA